MMKTERLDVRITLSIFLAYLLPTVCLQNGQSDAISALNMMKMVGLVREYVHSSGIHTAKCVLAKWTVSCHKCTNTMEMVGTFVRIGSPEEHVEVDLKLILIICEVFVRISHKLK